MARDQEPLTDAEIEQLREEMNEQRQDIKSFLEDEGVDVTGWDEGQTEARADGGN